MVYSLFLCLFFMEKRLGKFKNGWENLDSEAPHIDARSKTR